LNIYLAIILFIISIVTGIISLFAGGNFSKRNFFTGISIHVLFIILFIIYATAENKSTYPALFKLSFLFTICSGLILCGIAWKTSASFIFKTYFSLYLITILLFIFSPSRLINFLLSASYADTTGKTFNVKDNYFLEEQTSSMNSSPAVPVYKLVRKSGMFHETIQRNISFNGDLDSIRVLEFITNERALIRGYSGKNTYVSSEVDSDDVELNLVKTKKGQIERRL
jgi:hypothetical protein